MITNTATRYGLVARLFHWTIAILVLADIVLGVRGQRRTAYQYPRQAHICVSTCVLGGKCAVAKRPGRNPS